MEEHPTLLELLEDRFGTVPDGERLDHVGRLTAKAWALGVDGMRALGFLLPRTLHAGLADEAALVLEGDAAGRAFLDRVREGLGFDDYLVAFLQTLERWAEDETQSILPRGVQTQAMPAVPTLSMGDDLGQYVILGAIGEGGMGRVYRANQTSLDREVAIKVLHPQYAQDATFLRRFEKEAQAAAKLRHANVVQVYEAGAERGLHYIVFEYVDGTSLGEVLGERGRLPEPEALGIALAVARALQCAEEHGYVHRDVKPSNILIGPDGVVKLSDLGLARQVDDESRMTSVGLVLGTPHYMAPEQAMDDRNVDVRADLYALGLTLFELLTGSLPFTGRTAVAVISQHVNQDVPSPRGFVPGVEVSEAAARLVGWLADRKPERRYPSAAEAVASVERVLKGLPPVRPSTLPPAAEEPRAPGRSKSSSYYSSSGELLTGPARDEVSASEEVRADETRTSLGRWAARLRGSQGRRPDPPPAADPDADQLLLSDDTQRAYRLAKQARTASSIREVEVLGRQDFAGFSRPVERAVLKRVEAWRAIDAEADRRCARVLDHGEGRSGRPYLVVERLRGTPRERYRGPNQSQVPVDPATAVELFVNLLDRLKGLHFRRKHPLILCDIKPETVRLRIPTEDGALTDAEYLARLAEGRYEPVFDAVGCAQDRDALRRAAGRPDELLGTPIFLAPESIPLEDDGVLSPGTYGVESDVYALTLTFYEWISGRRAYQHLESKWIAASDPLLTLLRLKREGADPIDPRAVRGLLGEHGEAVVEVLRAGLEPDPAKRATTVQLLALCKKTFRLEARKRSKGDYAFDDPNNHLAYRQRVFPPLDPQANDYLSARRVGAD